MELGPSCICPEAKAIFAIGPKLAMPGWVKLIGEKQDEKDDADRTATLVAIASENSDREQRRQADLARKSRGGRARPSYLGQRIPRRAA